jgi:hypothetical protein
MVIIVVFYSGDYRGGRRPVSSLAHRAAPTVRPMTPMQLIIGPDEICIPLSPDSPRAPVSPDRGATPSTGEPHHAAIARVINATGGARSLGSGALVYNDGEYGVVVTCAHLFREGAGELTAWFPDGAAFGGRLLGLDPTWDLAALLIAAPTARPIAIARDAPRPGDSLTSCGYGSDGRLWCNRGAALQYVVVGGAPSAETLELSGMARQGDSGGPIFNTRAELAGVLHGTNGEVVVGTYCGRVRRFLSSVWPRFATTPGDSRSAPSGPPAPGALAPEISPGAPADESPLEESPAGPIAPSPDAPAGPVAESLDLVESKLGAVADLVRAMGERFSSREEAVDEKLSSLAGLVGAMAEQSASNPGNAASGSATSGSAAAGGLSSPVRQAIAAAISAASGDWLRWAVMAAAGGLGIGAPAAGLVLAVRVIAGLRRRRRRKRESNVKNSPPRGAGKESDAQRRHLNDDYARQLADVFSYSGRSPVQDATMGREYDRAIRDAETSTEPTIAKFARQLRDRVERTFHRIHGVSPAPAEPAG